MVPLQWLQENPNNIKNIDKTIIIEPFVTTVRQLFGMKNSDKSKKYNISGDFCDRNVESRVTFHGLFQETENIEGETVNGYKIENIGFDNIFEKLFTKDGKIKQNQSCHETFFHDGVYRLFFDIEPGSKCPDKGRCQSGCVACKNKICPIDEILNSIKNTLKELSNVTTGIIEVFSPIQDSSGQQKFRIYTNVAMTLPQMKVIARSIRIFDYWIDCGPYAQGKSLRFCNSYKYDQETDKYIKRAYKVGEDEFKRTIITYTSDCVTIPHSVALTKDIFFDIETEHNETLQLIKNILEPRFEGIKFQRYGRTSQKFIFEGGANKPCPSHPKVIHKSFGGIVYIEDESVVMKCWTRNKACGNSIIKYNLIKPKDIETGLQRVKLACERDNKFFDFDEDFEEFDTLNLNMNYIETDFQPFHLDSQIFIKSPMGTGKTQLVAQWIQKHFSDKRVLFVSFR